MNRIFSNRSSTEDRSDQIFANDAPSGPDQFPHRFTLGVAKTANSF